MNEKEPNPIQDPRTQSTEPQIVTNEYGQTKDAAVVVEEGNRTVLLTPNETVVFEKEPAINIVPKNRPRNVYAGMWGRNEIATVTLGIFSLLVVAIVYFFLVVPSNQQLARDRSEAETLQFDQLTANSRFGDITSTETQVAKLISSEENFEANFLPPMSSGRNALYQRLNGLIAAYGLVNTSGPDYSPLDANEHTVQGEQQQQDRGRDRFRSLFPGIYVSMTVEGSYQNLRRFVKELESGRDFVVVSSVQLEPSDNSSNRTAEQTNVQQSVQQPPVTNFPGNPNVNPRTYIQPNPSNNLQPQVDRGKTHGEVVSLHLEMAAYFRRPNFVPTVAQ
jgi:Tfp pilus assembly protein PilO